MPMAGSRMFDEEGTSRNLPKIEAIEPRCGIAEAGFFYAHKQDALSKIFRKIV